jgi:hypothetical protein
MSHLNHLVDDKDKHYAQHVEHIDNGSLKGDVDVFHMSAEDRAVALRLAQEADPGHATFSYRNFVFVCIVLVVCMCSGDNGECIEVFAGQGLTCQALTGRSCHLSTR